MAAVTRNLIADQGATFKLSIRYKDSAGTPVDLTGYTAVFSVLTRGTGGLIDSAVGAVGADGWITFSVPDEQTLLWPMGKNAYRVELENPAGDVFFLLVGALSTRSGNDV